MNILVSIGFWHIIAILMSTIGTIMSLLKIIIKEALGLSDRQAIHPDVAKNTVYGKWHKYKNLELLYSKYNLFCIGLLLIVIGAIIEIILVRIEP